VFAALNDERSNVEAIVQRAFAVRDLDALESALGFVDVTYEARGALAEGRRLLEDVEALLRDDATAAPLRARTLIDLGWFHHRLGAIEAGRARTREGLELLGPDASVALSARGTMNLALAEGALGRRDRAEPLLRRALELARASGDEGLAASVLGSLGIHESESERAAAHFEEAVSLHERGGRILSAIRETGNLAIAYGILGDLPRSGGRPAVAAALVQVVLADPAVRSYTSGVAASLRERLTSTLTPAEVDAAAAFGRDVTVTEALGWARDGGWPAGG
jgi:tetratricopeptide (TPR) repeat protein